MKMHRDFNHDILVDKFNSKIIRALLIILLSCCIFSTTAQNFCKLKFQSYVIKNGIKEYSLPVYEALLVDYGGDKAIMRVRYFVDSYASGTEPVIVEQDISSYESYTRQSHNKVWVYAGSKVKFISGSSEYEPDTIVLKRTTDGKYIFDYAYSWFNGIYQFSDIFDYKILSRSEVTNEYLARFNWEWRDSGSPETALENPLSDVKLNLILVTNTLDLSVGHGFIQNRNSLSQIFREAAEAVGMQFNLVEVKGENFNKSTLRNVIESLSADNNDVIIFYYSGHGFRYDDDGQDDWLPHMIMTTRNSYNPVDYEVPLLSVAQSMLSKNAGLTMIISDCCNKGMGFRNRTVSDPVRYASANFQYSNNSLKKLFTSKGSIVVSAASPGEFALYYDNSGGYYCNFFCESFREVAGRMYNDEVSWQQIFNMAKTETIKKSQEDKEYENQTPMQTNFVTR